jgi:hypothetical protein
MSSITKEFTFECDDINEFLDVAKFIIPVLFQAGSNEKSQYHNMYYDKSESPNYWILMPEYDGKDEPKRKCVICLTHHLSKPNRESEIEVPMEFKTNDTDKLSWRNKLKWKKKGYKKLLDIIKNSIDVDEDEFKKSFPVNGWIDEETDGSNGLNYKMEWRDSTPGSLYISLGYTYYSK